MLNEIRDRGVCVREEKEEAEKKKTYIKYFFAILGY